MVTFFYLNFTLFYQTKINTGPLIYTFVSPWLVLFEVEPVGILRLFLVQDYGTMDRMSIFTGWLGLVPTMRSVCTSELLAGMKVRMNQTDRQIKSMGIYIINEPGFQGGAGLWRGKGAASLLGGSGGKLLNFWNFKSTKLHLLT